MPIAGTFRLTKSLSAGAVVVEPTALLLTLVFKGDVLRTEISSLVAERHSTAPACCFTLCGLGTCIGGIIVAVTAHTVILVPDTVIPCDLDFL